MSRPLSRAAGPLACGLLAILGCSPAGPQVSQVSGRVTLDGKPVTAGRVMFLAADDSNSANGELDENGNYTIVGAPAGDVRVAIEVEPYRLAPAFGAEPLSPAANSEDSGAHVPAEYAGGWRRNPRYVPIPDRYTEFDTAGLTVTVPPDEEFVYDIRLEPGPQDR